MPDFDIDQLKNLKENQIARLSEANRAISKVLQEDSTFRKAMDKGLFRSTTRKKLETIMQKIINVKADFR